VGQWVKANGGPLAIVVVGLGTISIWPLGAVLIAIGSIWFLATLPFAQKRIPWRVVRKQALATRRISEQEIGRRCLVLAERLNERLAEHRRTDPRVVFWGVKEPDWDKEQRAENEHRAKLEAWFIERHQAETVFLLDELQKQHLLDLGDEEGLWRLGFTSFSEHDIDHIAKLFATVGHRLRGDEA
jgi:hypothetical protein